MKKIVPLIAVAGIALGAAGAAQAHVSVGIGIGHHFGGSDRCPEGPRALASLAVAASLRVTAAVGSFMANILQGLRASSQSVLGASSKFAPMQLGEMSFPFLRGQQRKYPRIVRFICSTTQARNGIHETNETNFRGFRMFTSVARHNTRSTISEFQPCPRRKPTSRAFEN